MADCASYFGDEMRQVYLAAALADVKERKPFQESRDEARTIFRLEGQQASAFDAMYQRLHGRVQRLLDMGVLDDVYEESE